MNRQFRVKGITGVETSIELINDAAGGYDARITSITEYGVRESVEYISDDLLDSCLRTGYLTEVKATETATVENATRQPALTA